MSYSAMKIQKHVQSLERNLAQRSVSNMLITTSKYNSINIVSKEHLQNKAVFLYAATFLKGTSFYQVFHLISQRRKSKYIQRYSLSSSPKTKRNNYMSIINRDWFRKLFIYIVMYYVKKCRK